MARFVKTFAVSLFILSPDDRGYNNYGLLGRWTAQGVYFVTRMKENALYEVIGEKEVPQHRHILKDQQIELREWGPIEKCPYPLRRIEVYDPEKDEVLAFLTNHPTLGATTIAAIYKDRWQIELFFKALKQNLKIKTLVGTSPNAVKIIRTKFVVGALFFMLIELTPKLWYLPPRDTARGNVHGRPDPKHLQAYLNEYCYRVNRRFWENQLFPRLVAACANCEPITYSELTQ